MKTTALDLDELDVGDCLVGGGLQPLAPALEG